MPAARKRWNDSSALPRRANTSGQWATEAPDRRQDLEVAAAGQPGQAVGGVDDAVADDGVGPEQPACRPGTRSASGQWRRRISWNSSRFWPAWISMPTPSSSAAFRVARSNAGLQVSTWNGKSMPWMRPPWAAGVLAHEARGRARGARKPRLLVQLVDELAALADPVVVRLVGRAQVRADPQLAGDRRVLLGGRADLDHRRAAVAEQLHQREAAADPGSWRAGRFFTPGARRCS